MGRAIFRHRWPVRKYYTVYTYTVRYEILVILLGPEAQPLPRGDAAHSPFISNQNVRASAHFFTGCPLPPSLSMGAASHATCSRAAAADNHGSEWNARPTRPPLSLAMTVCPARLLARSGPARLPAPAARARRSALGRCVCLHAVIKRRERASRARAPRRAESAGQLYGHDW